MGTERHRTARSGAEGRELQHELLRSLHAAVDTLAVCLQQIEDLIHQVDSHLLDPGEARAPHARPQISFGGGPSVIGTTRALDRRGGER